MKQIKLYWNKLTWPIISDFKMLLVCHYGHRFEFQSFYVFIWFLRTQHGWKSHKRFIRYGENSFLQVLISIHVSKLNWLYNPKLMLFLASYEKCWVCKCGHFFNSQLQVLCLVLFIILSSCKDNMQYMACISNCIHMKWWDVCTHLCHKFIGDLDKSLLKLWHG